VLHFPEFKHLFARFDLPILPSPSDAPAAYVLRAG
jgi:hypothetical protein